MTATGANRPGRPSRPSAGPEPTARRPRTQEPVTPASRRIPFAVLLVAVLGGGLCALLTLNTALAASEVRQRNLDAANDALNDREQQLAREVAALQAPTALARRATELGLVPADAPAFLRIGPDGSVTVLGHPAPASAAVPDPIPKTTGPKTTGPKTTGPKTTGPKTSGRPVATTTAATTPPTTGVTGARPPAGTPRGTPAPAPTHTPTVTLPGGPR